MIKNILKCFIIISVLFFTSVCSYAKKDTCPYRIIQDPEGVYVVEIMNTPKSKYKLVPYVSDELETNREVYEKTNAKLAFNTGFFDPKNKKTVSYIVSYGSLVASPKDNENLMKNATLTPYLDKILNRTEFRIMQDFKNNVVYDITPHNAPVPNDYTLIHSIQGGPMLLPDLRLEEEFFVLMKNGKIVSESASSLHKYARTAIGIRENNVYLFIITTKAPMNLSEVADLTKKWGMEKAMAFDGGGSTSFDSQELHVISEKNNEARKLKSFFILKSI